LLTWLGTTAMPANKGMKLTKPSVLKLRSLSPVLSGLDMELSDPRWSTLNSAYRIPFDPRDALRQLEQGRSQEAWDCFWTELHHQGAVDTASYATVPQLVRIHRDRQLFAWQTYALATTIELASRSPQNPQVPEWLEQDYRGAINELASLGLEELPRADDATHVSAILAFLALWKAARTYARLMNLFSDEELAAVEDQLVACALEGPRDAG
jgi:hypothetical protein